MKRDLSTLEKMIDIVREAFATGRIPLGNFDVLYISAKALTLAYKDA